MGKTSKATPSRVKLILRKLTLDAFQLDYNGQGVGQWVGYSNDQGYTGSRVPVRGNREAGFKQFFYNGGRADGNGRLVAVC